MTRCDVIGEGDKCEEKEMTWMTVGRDNMETLGLVCRHALA